MKTWKPGEFEESGVLDDVDNAAFYAKKIGPEDQIDFDGVVSVTEEYLNALLRGRTPEELEGRLTGVSDSVDEALALWVDRQGDPKPVDGPDRTVTTKVVVARAAEKPLEFQRSEPEGERYTPTRLASRLKEQITSYIESAYPLSDPVLVRSRRSLLQEASDGRLLAQEPYIETTPRYEFFEGSYNDLGLRSETAELFTRLSQTEQAHSGSEKAKTILYESFFGHQAKVFESFFVDGKEIVVATGTGSGKTECFLLPILGTLFEEAVRRPESWSRPGVRALVLYPMNALVNDQLSRLRLLFGDPAVAREFDSLGPEARHPLFGMYTGRTPYPGPRTAARDRERVRPLLEYYTTLTPDLRAELTRLGRYPAKDLEAFYGKSLEEPAVYKSGKKAGQSYTKYHWKKRLHTHPGDRELLTRQEMVRGAGTRPGNAPDILVTNYSMLEYMLMRPFERPLFRQTASWLAEEDSEFLLVLDEAHMYRGAKGAEVGFLLRRLRARLGINDRPEKLRVICTSASLGSTEEALESIRRFAADLTGKRPDDFVAVTGRRQIPGEVGEAPDDLAEILAEVDLDHLHAAAEPKRLQEALAPLFTWLGKPCPSTSEEEILAHLANVLGDQPFVQLVIKETAGEAKALGDLARRVFGDHPRRRKAMEVLLSLGAIARSRKDEPGLIPTRVHAMFRGLHALYACLNQDCSGRQDSPGATATLGKLFVAPRSTCDACGSRVFELASCRNCGTPYLYAFAAGPGLGGLDFLWGETEGNLARVELLPARPRYAEATEELRVHLTTGYLDPAFGFPDEQVRPLWIARGDEGREPSFRRCALCQPPGSRARSQITDFRTKGEQPFTALLEAQFGEQPPQKKDKTLPNKGRKVLVFSDGRQKAARLAPALEHSHARDLFRQVLALAVRSLESETGHRGLDKLYPATVWTCLDRGLNLFPSPDESEFRDHLRRSTSKSLTELVSDFNQGFLRPTQSYAQQLFSEMTDRYYSLNALALATVEEDPLVDRIFESFPKVSIPEDSIPILFRSWLRLQLEGRRFLPQGADIGNLGEGWETPDGMDAKNEKHLFPGSFDGYLVKILGDESSVAEVSEWFAKTVRESGLFRFENDRYFLQPLGLSLKLRLDSGWLSCRDCGRTYAEALDDTCPSCLGNVGQADPDYVDARTGYYRRQVLRAFDETSLEPFGLTTAEHSAQLTGLDDADAFSKTEKYELQFQDIRVDSGEPIDVLSCTTTMEVGIDIGTLSGVALRNVPPHVANYQQRAGRAGRRGRSVASVVTFAHGTSHDAHFYLHPERIISGDVRPPIVYVENQQVLKRHVNAYLVQRFFHETVVAGSETYRLFESLGTVEQFLSGQYACSLENLERWLEEEREKLRSELDHWVPRWSFGLDEEIPQVAETVREALDHLRGSLRRVLPVEDFARREELDGLARESLERQLEEGLLETLISRAVFPRYAFPTDVVGFWVPQRRWKGDPAFKRNFDYEPQRDLQIALSEYAPGSSLTIDKYRFDSAAIYSPYAPEVGPTLDRARPYTACESCGWVSLAEEAQGLAICPCCRNEELLRTPFVRPQGFASDVNERRQIDRGEASMRAGRTSRAQLEVQEPPASWDLHTFGGRMSVVARSENLVVVNKGVGDRGFNVCPECGRTEPLQGPGFTRTALVRGGAPRRHLKPLEEGTQCDGQARGPFFLGHSFPTDILLVRVSFEAPFRCSTVDADGRSGKPARIALTSFVEAMSLAASRRLQIDEGELGGNWSPVLGGAGSEAHVFLYDLLPGGAGYTRQVRENLDDVMSEMRALLEGCDCETSCYQCLRHYGNNFFHHSLDRRLASALVQWIVEGEVPTVSEAEGRRALRPLVDLLNLKGLSTVTDVRRGGARVPLVAVREDGSEIWIETRHPLVELAPGSSVVARAAETEFVEYLALDTYTLEHDLPAAVEALQV